MSVATEIQRLNTAKADIKTAIEAKGVTVPSSATIDTYDDYVSQISGGGGGGSSADTEALKGMITRDITGITIPSGVTTIGMYAFADCTSLKRVNSDIDGVFNIPSGVTSISIHAFDGCIRMTSVDIPNSVTSIGNQAFRGCNNLTSINIPSGVTSINEYLFYNCYNLTSITIPDSVTSISGSAFSGCRSLTSVEIPSGVTSIGTYAFNNASGLTSITINATTPPTLSNVNTFNNTNNCPIYVPCGSVDTYKAASKWSDLSSRITCAQPSFQGKWLATYSDSHTESAQCDSSSAITEGEISFTNLVSVEIGGTCVTSIDDYAFASCESLTSIDIPDSVTSIGEGAFAFCSSLTSIDIPNTVTSIGRSVFFGCGSLTSCTIGSGVTSIGTAAFEQCTGLTSVTVNATTPPTLGGGAFDSTNDYPIYVPSGSVSAYQSAWRDYSSRIQAIPNS